MQVNPGRTRKIAGEGRGGRCVVYWMSREQRARDNWALIFAAGLARKHGAYLAVVFCLVDDFLGATWRAYDFMLRGLEEVHSDLAGRGIPFYMLRGDPAEEVAEFIRRHDAGWLVVDFDPLRVKRTWRRRAARASGIDIYEVDAHNIVPCWVASDKQEYAAYTLRPKVHRALPEFLDLYPAALPRPRPFEGRAPGVSWKSISRGLAVDRDVEPVRWLAPGGRAGMRRLKRFLRDGLGGYPDGRNDPVLDGQSNLSPYIHFGQISAQRVAIEVEKSGAPTRAKEAFLEELIVRRELSDNFCYYSAGYDRAQSFPQWAALTLGEHAEDPREYVYTLSQLERGLTHDSLWNAAQLEMVRRGKMHGYMRMYWAKKILEWTRSAKTAMRFAIFLNDRYELDGRDPNGYAGIAWSIGGVHDRAWGERPVFGKVRYMSYKGMRSKFDVDAYVEKYSARL